MKKMPTLQTPRLTLRPFKLSDSAVVKQYANDKDIATNTQNLPHPYEEYMAVQWIAGHDDLFARDVLLNLAIVTRKGDKYIGAIGLEFDWKNDSAELGYWLGKPFWGNGYATEAARRIVHYAFEELKLNRIHSCHLSENLASGKVLTKIGMHHEGHMPQHIKKWGEYKDVELFGMVRADYRP